MPSSRQILLPATKTTANNYLNNLQPFVYRKYLDFAAVESIREMKEMIERELSRKKELQKNIKLGPGGIREIEFIAQAHQLIRGGRDKSLQQRSLLLVLDQLKDSALISDSEFAVLRQGYYFLRRCENRLQMYADQQTHNLPDDEIQQLILAHSMGYSDWPSFIWNCVSICTAYIRFFMIFSCRRQILNKTHRHLICRTFGTMSWTMSRPAITCRKSLSAGC